jgi:hypothetical protein
MTGGEMSIIAGAMQKATKSKKNQDKRVQWGAGAKGQPGVCLWRPRSLSSRPSPLALLELLHHAGTASLAACCLLLKAPPRFLSLYLCYPLLE